MSANVLLVECNQTCEIQTELHSECSLQLYSKIQDATSWLTSTVLNLVPASIAESSDRFRREAFVKLCLKSVKYVCQSYYPHFYDECFNANNSIQWSEMSNRVNNAYCDLIRTDSNNETVKFETIKKRYNLNDDETAFIVLKLSKEFCLNCTYLDETFDANKFVKKQYGNFLKRKFRNEIFNWKFLLKVFLIMTAVVFGIRQLFFTETLTTVNITNISIIQPIRATEMFSQDIIEQSDRNTEAVIMFFVIFLFILLLMRLIWFLKYPNVSSVSKQKSLIQPSKKSTRINYKALIFGNKILSKLKSKN